jgi:hypothetical protein
MGVSVNAKNLEKNHDSRQLDLFMEAPPFYHFQTFGVTHVTNSAKSGIGRGSVVSFCSPGGGVLLKYCM